MIGRRKPTEVVRAHDVQWGRDELGRPAAWPLGKGHLLAAGGTGAGKSSLFRSVACRLAPAADVQLAGVDLKLIELTFLGDRLSALALHPADALDLIEAVGELLNLRLRWAAANGWREWQPSPGRPYLGLLIDELAELTTGPAERAALERILRLGRALGIGVVAATQRAEATGPTGIGATTRDQFAWRLAMASATPGSYELALGDITPAIEALARDLSVTRPGCGIHRAPGLPDRICRVEWWEDDQVAARLARHAHLTMPFGRIIAAARADLESIGVAA